MTILDEIRRAAELPPESAIALPFAAYESSEVFEREMATVFSRDWIAVCAAAELPNPGDCIAFSLADEPVVVVRGGDGRLWALSNVCRHRGTILQDDGFANVKKLVCPYHAWTYDLEGQLRGVPMPGSVVVDKPAHCLPSFGVTEWAGVVFVNLDPAGEPLDRRLRGIERYLEPFALDSFDTVATATALDTWDANWKLVLANAMESYHVFRVHERTLETVAPTKGAFYLEGSPAWTVTGGMYAGHETTADRDHAISDLVEGGYVVVSIPPSFVGILTAEYWGWLALRPIGVEKTVVVAAALRSGAPGFLERLTSGDAAAEFTKAFFGEDRWICERNQRGMKSRRSRGGQLVELERVVVDFHRYLASRLFENG